MLGAGNTGDSHIERFLGCNFTGSTGAVQRGPIERGTFASAWPDACSFERRGTILLPQNAWDEGRKKLSEPDYMFSLSDDAMHCNTAYAGITG
jgi:hypothetical protein